MQSLDKVVTKVSGWEGGGKREIERERKRERERER